MQPFTFDQAIIAGLLFILGIFIGMFFLAGGKWKRRYRAEVVERTALARENERLAAESRAHDTRHTEVTHREVRSNEPVQTTVVERHDVSRRRPGETMIGRD
ncbi:MAG TPA: hypothetical protein VEZ48_09195 [Sphingomonadaceae bacterium]|nr:hypothetical protein [Sphingomonadaceae bacterium]